MPKITAERTFTACWTCRRRNIRCDKTKPHCLQCNRSRVPCEGYHIRLVWVNPDTGEYCPQQRRSYRSDLTWYRYSTWTDKEVSHLIKDSEERKCRCSLHKLPNPFSTFSYKDFDVISSSDSEFYTEATPEEPPSNEQSEFGLGSPMPSSTDLEELSVGMELGIDTQFTLDEDQPGRFHERTYFDIDTSSSSTLDAFVNEATNLCDNQDANSMAMSLFIPPSPSIAPNDNREESRLFFHYVSHVSGLMIPIEDVGNPWKSTYPSLAIREASSNSRNSLYHAILAQSAFHLAASKGPERGAQDNAAALRHYGIGLRQLRDSLTAPTEEYSSVMAALLTVILLETIARGKLRTWRHHFRGATGFVSQYFSQKPWLMSRDAWIITQSFAQDIVLAHTAGNDSATTDHISKIYGVLSEVAAEPRFGFTIGGNARLIKAVYHTLLLEERIATVHPSPDEQVVDEDILMQSEQIVDQLRDSLKNDVDLYLQHQERDGVKMLPRTRTLVKVHLHLFNKAVMVYLHRMVLRRPPSSVADYVSEVLTNAIVFLDMNGGEPSIWPIFIAAVEAYTPEAQDMVNHFFDESKLRGTGLREDMRGIIRQVWADRERLSAESQCSPGDVSVNWREVTKRLDVDLLLL